MKKIFTVNGKKDVKKMKVFLLILLMLSSANVVRASTLPESAEGQSVFISIHTNAKVHKSISIKLESLLYNGNYNIPGPGIYKFPIAKVECETNFPYSIEIHAGDPPSHDKYVLPTSYALSHFRHVDPFDNPYPNTFVVSTEKGILEKNLPGGVKITRYLWIKIEVDEEWPTGDYEDKDGLLLYAIPQP